jgi:hypothetical protein
MRISKLASLVTLSIIGLGSTMSIDAVWAQREPPTREERRDLRRQQTQNMTPEQRQQYYQQRMQERMRTMTPEQRQRWDARRAQMEQMRRQEQIASVSGDDRQRYLMQSAGVSDTTVQDAIIAFVNDQAQKRQTVTEAARKLSDLMADASATPDAISAQLEVLRAASKEFRTWKEGALKELDAKIGYSKDSRLQSLLVLVGIIGYESTDAGGFNAIFPKGVAGEGDIIDLLPKTDNNQGGFGGWGGGGRGGRGGQNAGGQNGDAQNAAPADAPAPAN